MLITFVLSYDFIFCYMFIRIPMKCPHFELMDILMIVATAVVLLLSFSNCHSCEYWIVCSDRAIRQDDVVSKVLSSSLI